MRALRRRSLRRNTIANLVSRIVPAAIALFAIPILLSRLGADAYGLVGLSVTLEALFAFLDFGLSTATNREVARNVAAGAPSDTNRDLLRTLEVLYWPIGLLILTIVLAGADWAASRTLDSRLPQATVEAAIVVLGVMLAIRWPVSLYLGVLRGLQAHVLLNVVVAGGTVFRVFAGLATVVWISPTIRAFFVSQVVGAVVQLSSAMMAAWMSLPRGNQRPAFRFEVLRGVGRFAAGAGAVAILFQVLYQSGMLFVADQLPLREAGYYAVSLSLAGVAVYVPYAVVDAAFPRFAGQLHRGAIAPFADAYRRAILVSVAAALALALPTVFYARDLIFVWTGSESVGRNAGGAATLLALGNLLYALWAVPYTAVMASGATRGPLILNLVVVPIVILGTAWATSQAGLAGAAGVWAGANVAFAVAYPFYVRSVTGSNATMTAYGEAILLVAMGVSLFAASALATQGASHGTRVLGAMIAALLLLGASFIRLRPVLAAAASGRPSER